MITNVCSYVYNWWSHWWLIRNSSIMLSLWHFHCTKSQKWMFYVNQPCLHAGSDWKSAVDDVFVLRCYLLIRKTMLLFSKKGTLRLTPFWGVHSFPLNSDTRSWKLSPAVVYGPVSVFMHVLKSTYVYGSSCNLHNHPATQPYVVNGMAKLLALQWGFRTNTAIGNIVMP